MSIGIQLRDVTYPHTCAGTAQGGARLYDGDEHRREDGEDGPVLRDGVAEVRVKQHKRAQQQHAQRPQHDPVQRRQQRRRECAAP